jgi:hypothetical protein
MHTVGSDSCPPVRLLSGGSLRKLLLLALRVELDHLLDEAGTPERRRVLVDVLQCPSVLLISNSLAE